MSLPHKDKPVLAVPLPRSSLQEEEEEEANRPSALDLDRQVDGRGGLRFEQTGCEC